MFVRNGKTLLVVSVLHVFGCSGEMRHPVEPPNSAKVAKEIGEWVKTELNNTPSFVLRWGKVTSPDVFPSYRIWEGFEGRISFTVDLTLQCEKYPADVEVAVWGGPKIERVGEITGLPSNSDIDPDKNFLVLDGARLMIKRPDGYPGHCLIRLGVTHPDFSHPGKNSAK